jgi:threonine/homoserine/homoserine lactone efflux protein
VIEPTALLAWSALALIVTISPGPDTVLIASHAARGGLRAGLAAVAGTLAGGVYYASLFGFGVLALLTAVPALYMTVKIAGALYLAWLGVRLIWRAAQGDAGAIKQGAGAALRRPFSQAFLTNALNPKVAIFYLAALPQFAAGPNAPIVGALLIGIHYAFGGLWLSGIAYAASRARRIAWNRNVVRWLEGAIGAFFVAVAGRLALAQR